MKTDKRMVWRVTAIVIAVGLLGWQWLRPHHTVESAPDERAPLASTSAPGNHREAVTAILDRMELPKGSADRYPHEFSGGQRQRIALARALVHGPELLVADEPVSALDVSVRAQVLNLLHELVEQFGLTLVFVSHDLAVVRHVCDRVVVMQHGRVVESGPIAEVYERPRVQYTQELLAAMPRIRLA